MMKQQDGVVGVIVSDPEGGLYVIVKINNRELPSDCSFNREYCLVPYHILANIEEIDFEKLIMIKFTVKGTVFSDSHFAKHFTPCFDLAPFVFTPCNKLLVKRKKLKTISSWE